MNKGTIAMGQMCVGEKGPWADSHFSSPVKPSGLIEPLYLVPAYQRFTKFRLRQPKQAGACFKSVLTACLGVGYEPAQ